MLIVNGKMMLRVDNQIINPGEKKDLPDKVAENLVKVGLAQKAKKGEVATAPKAEKATMPKPTRKKRKKKEAGD